ncbi:class I SAM-dependent methyltransferase [Agrobacterium vitis]|uniref:Methyltransferase domain-containing protein n=1 Tax=Agrobacterium vitis TaxID=373 RepID=A0A7K1RBD9_AGRVI|nr:class I SAM-dependent methyltransferase [Agrobacterium vitis]MVA55451.1 methyltransferase domain-containing protein [Agrobacterium vitis]
MPTATSEKNTVNENHDHHVQQNFGPRASAYVESAVHASGADLTRLGDIARTAAASHGVDLGCGGGHVAYAIAPYMKTVTAIDLSADMLAAVSQTATERDLTNIATLRASAEHLPCEDGQFDFLACRFSAHHWHDVHAGLRQAQRVLKPGAPAIFIDVVSPPSPLLNTHLQAVELLRDTSHVRNYMLSEWTQMLGQAGFAITTCQTSRLRMDFKVWTDRMKTPDAMRAAIRLLQQDAATETKAHFEIESDGSFMLDVALFETHRI